MGCGCTSAGQAPAIPGAPLPPGPEARPIVHPEHRWRGGEVVRTGAVGPEVAADLRARALGMVNAARTALVGTLNGRRGRTYRGDHPVGPVIVPNRYSLDSIDPDGPGATAQGRRLPPDWWFVWDGETGAAGAPESEVS